MKLCIVYAIFLSLLVNVGFAQTVDDILDNYFKETGGLEARMSLNSIQITGIAPTPRGEFPITLYTKSPNRLKVVLEIQGEDYIAQAYDGSVAWGLNPFQGGKNAEKMNEEQTRSIAEGADFDESYVFSKFIDYKKKGYIITLLGKEDVNDEESYKIKVVSKDSQPNEPVEYYYFDANSYLLNKYTVQGKDEEGNIWSRHQLFDDYETVEGNLKLPFYYELRVNDNVVRKLIAKNIEVNKKIEDSVFAFPN